MLKGHGQEYLVGNKLSRADIHLVELLYYVEELDPTLLANFPLLKVSSLTAFGGSPHLPPWHLLSGPWDCDARVPDTVQASLPPGLHSSLQGLGLGHGKNLVTPKTLEMVAAPRRMTCLFPGERPRT